MVGTPAPPVEHFLRLTTCVHREGSGGQSCGHCSHSQATSLPQSPAPLRGDDLIHPSDRLDTPLFAGSRPHSQCLSPLLRTPISLCVNTLQLAWVAWEVSLL